jgi:hypothetical protein
MTDRIERHREMAKAFFQPHLDAVAANVAGRKQELTGQPGLPVGMVFYISGWGDVVGEPNRGWANSDGAHRELMMHWQKIPDFGVKEQYVYPAEDGWINFSYWGGTDTEGQKHGAWEANRIFTDEDFNVTRIEAIIDMKEWMDRAAWVNDRPKDGFSIEDYMDNMDRMQPGK